MATSQQRKSQLTTRLKLAKPKKRLQIAARIERPAALTARTSATATMIAAAVAAIAEDVTATAIAGVTRRT
jgi:hypothetical protein